MIEHVTAGVPLVLCHGLFGFLSDPVLLAPFEGREVLAPDLLGYGQYSDADVDVLTLEDQADHVVGVMDGASIDRADIVGHSVGGAVAVLVATRHAERVREIVCVEGNMTPPDAFWSAELANKEPSEIAAMIDDYGADVAAWIAGAGVQATERNLRIATGWLRHQPATTLRAQAAAVVRATSDRSGYLDALRDRLWDGLVLHLMAGARSRIDWHVPPEIVAEASTMTILANRGHLMMLESPGEFAAAVQGVTRSGADRSRTAAS